MSSVDQTIQQLNIITTVTISIVYLGNFVFGVIGLTFNVFVFTRPVLRETPCSIYFLAATFVNFFVILFIIPVRLLLNNFNIDLSTYNPVYCKIQSFVFFTIRALSCWLITMACIDRYLHSSPEISSRRWSSLKTAKISIALVSIIIPISYSHMFIFYNLIQLRRSTGILVYSCTTQDPIYSTFINVWHLLMYSLFPSLLMLIFGCLTLKNIRFRDRVFPQNVHRATRRKRTDLLHMLFAQVIVIIICTGAFSVYQLYALFTSRLAKDSFRISQESAAIKISGVLSYFPHSTSFYMFTLTGSTFRKEVVRVVRPCLFRKRNRVQIITVRINRGTRW
ncbi:unnamed protein product [Adineta ricciae]|uniref:G-protein coupled receptors family 1 profile domain-containing protein n=1 Tax=Adineta ricciae TaxID=249248 RepID=A0A814ZSM7_ADIRI|nr:unnamed protein product [Adineta ricciae]CAF1419879.1 unnamed protein product [Adineta ricciae]